MQDRAWKSSIRTALAEKRNRITIFHVKAHQGLQSPEQRGNDHADRMAKQFMSEGERLNPLPYFVAAEENFLAFHGDTLIGGNIRLWLKEQETEQLQNAWRRLKIQGKLFRRFPQQIQDLTKSIRKWAIERVEEKAWIFFIAIRDWFHLFLMYR